MQTTTPNPRSGSSFGAMLIAFLIIAVILNAKKCSSQCHPEGINPLGLTNPLSQHFDQGHYAMLKLKVGNVTYPTASWATLVHFLTTFGAPDLNCDLNADGIVDFSDLAIFLTGFGAPSPALMFYDFDIMFQASSGWGMTYAMPTLEVLSQTYTIPPLNTHFMHRTGYDESEESELDEGCLNSMDILILPASAPAIRITYVKIP